VEKKGTKTLMGRIDAMHPQSKEGPPIWNQYRAAKTYIKDERLRVRARHLDIKEPG